MPYVGAKKFLSIAFSGVPKVMRVCLREKMRPTRLDFISVCVCD
jgi:hypothetical protein